MENEELLEAFIQQLTVGCQSPICTNPSCKSCPNFQFENVDDEEIEELAYELIKNRDNICKNLNPLIYDNDIFESVYIFQVFTNSLIHENSDLEISELESIISNIDYLAFCLYDLESDAFSQQDLCVDDDLISDFYDASIRRQTELKGLYPNYHKVIDSLVSKEISALHQLRTILIVLSFGNFTLYPYFNDIYIPLITSINNLIPKCKRIFTDSLKNLPKFMKRILATAETNLTLYCIKPNHRLIVRQSDSVKQLLTFIQSLFIVSCEMNDPISIQEFANEALSDILSPNHELVEFLNSRFSFLNYPMILTLPFKDEVREVEAQAIMESAQGSGVTINENTKPSDFLLTLEVNRQNMIKDTISQLMNKSKIDLSKKLYITFKGEKGVDAGGVSREYFYLITSMIFSPDYGMFDLIEDRFYWFSLNSTFDEHNLQYFRIIGILIGLAINNSVILPIRFPVILYKKLQGKSVYTLKDLAEIKKDVAENLEKLRMSDDVSETYLTFSYDYRVYGTLKTVDFIENGRNIPVTNENVNNYIQLYINWILDNSIKNQFEAFKDGFLRVCNSMSMKLIYPEELDILVSGPEVFNWDDLKNHTVYSDGYDSQSPTVLMFWEAFDELTEKDKSKLLLFTVGTSKPPLKGLGNIGLVIQRTADTKKLPISHTCMKTLSLPDYKNKDIIKRNLQVCIENCEGFGIE
ncbi:ubiquitin ligase [Tritrichomonas foetus]|uniref:HECT-type E3 ubiquitin transferase n=1 Tax=Tritrichomonas foetus TaxID=1144522 RepID=A0A1J4KLP5_9EUKA|nr:ubiquitin ligase [Tritrichomonas foetus]|eukprot:OHT10301.1 ubiquitin ligase [Tritrichomonas foetus]